MASHANSTAAPKRAPYSPATGPAALWARQRSCLEILERSSLNDDDQDVLLFALYDLEHFARTLPIVTVEDAAARAEMAAEVMRYHEPQARNVASAEGLAGWLRSGGATASAGHLSQLAELHEALTVADNRWGAEREEADARSDRGVSGRANRLALASDRWRRALQALATWELATDAAGASLQLGLIIYNADAIAHEIHNNHALVDQLREIERLAFSVLQHVRPPGALKASIAYLVDEDVRATIAGQLEPAA